MFRRFVPFVALAVIAVVAGCAPQRATPPSAARLDTLAVQHAAHESYANAINSNNLDSLLAALTDDVVYLSPHEPVIVGKNAVRGWLDTYLKAYRIHWDKTTDEFWIAGDWAIERYSYVEADTAAGGGAILGDHGKGLNVYHHDADGRWRVARDAWNSDAPVEAK